MAIDDNTKLEVLHDHYKESFSHIREREKQRDRLFAIIIAYISILFLEILYSDNFSNILRNIKLEFVELNISIMPISVFLSITWTCLFFVVLKYNQTLILIERHYEYLHKLEKKISDAFEDQNIYCREGRAYLDKYPPFSNLVWIFYKLLLPVILTLLLGLIICLEIYKIKVPLYHLIYDLLLAMGVIMSVIFYRFSPSARDMLRIRNKVMKK